MGRGLRVLIGATCIVVLLSIGVAVGAAFGGNLGFSERASAVTGKWDYFAYDSRQEFDDALREIPADCDVDMEIVIAGSESLFAAIYNCSI